MTAEALVRKERSAFQCYPQTTQPGHPSLGIQDRGMRYGRPWWRTDAEEIGNVARVYGKHTIYLAIAIGCMKAIQELLELVFGRGAKIFGFLPIDWPFAAGDLVMACYFYYYATKEIKRVLGGHDDAH